MVECQEKGESLEAKRLAGHWRSFQQSRFAKQPETCRGFSRRPPQLLAKGKVKSEPLSDTFLLGAKSQVWGVRGHTWV